MKKKVKIKKPRFKKDEFYTYNEIYPTYIINPNNQQWELNTVDTTLVLQYKGRVYRYFRPLDKRRKTEVSTYIKFQIILSNNTERFSIGEEFILSLNKLDPMNGYGINKLKLIKNEST